MKSLSKSKIVSMLGSIALVMVAGCSDSNVETVKNGCFDSRPDVTIGAIMQERFKDCNWSSGKKSGRTVVTFTGKISKATHDLAMEKVSSIITSPFNLVEMIIYKQPVPEELREAYLERKKHSQLAAYEKKLYKVQYNSPEYKKIEQKIKDTKIQLMEECLNKLYWPTYSEVELQWVIFPDGKTFELDSVTNNSWSKFDLKWQHVMQILFSK